MWKDQQKYMKSDWKQFIITSEIKIQKLCWSLYTRTYLTLKGEPIPAVSSENGPRCTVGATHSTHWKYEHTVRMCKKNLDLSKRSLLWKLILHMLKTHAVNIFVNNIGSVENGPCSTVRATHTLYSTTHWKHWIE